MQSSKYWCANNLAVNLANRHLLYNVRQAEIDCIQLFRRTSMLRMLLHVRIHDFRLTSVLGRDMSVLATIENNILPDSPSVYTTTSNSAVVLINTNLDLTDVLLPFAIEYATG